jgi:peptidase M28-like protein/PDZ domain-containing protein
VPAALLLVASTTLPSALADTRPALSAEKVRADVSRLAGDDWQGRRAGTAGADAAAEWIAAEFRRAGLVPAGDGGTYFQTFTFIDGIVLGAGNRLAVGERAFKPGEEFRPLAFSSPGSVQAPAVFAGYGIVAKDLEYDDYGAVDVKDKVVVLLRYGPGGDDPQSKWAAFMPLRLKVSTARDKGASAVVIVTGPRTPGTQDQLVPLRSDASLSDAGIPAFSATRSVAEALLAGSGLSLDDAQRAIDEAQKPSPLALAGPPLEAIADLTPKRSSTRNVVGLLPSGRPADEAVVVGAHYDHLGLGTSGSLDPAPDGKIHHGADDNASGVAGLLELVRRYATRAEPRQRSLYFVAFGAEEEGVLGSSHFVKNPPRPLEKVAAMVNMDMIGRLRDDALEVHGVGTSPLLRPLVEEINRTAGLKLKYHEGGYGPSDHSPFYAAGRPVFFVFTGNHPDYHRPSDTADKIDADGLLRVLSLVDPVVNALATSPTPIAFTRVAAEKEGGAGGARGFRVWVGGIPDYSEEVSGVKFTGVTPGSPAEKAGLRGGDVLVRFGAKQIRNIYDYTYALGERKPGDAVTLVVKRDGQETTLEVVLGSRPSAAR